MKKRTKKVMSMLLVAALTAGISISGTMAYLTSEDSDVNVMTLGNVKIEQHEYERVENADGTYEEVDGGYELQDFTQAKPLLPIVGDPSASGDAHKGWDDTIVPMGQVDSYGTMQVFAGKNAVDKFVTVENTGMTDAYVRTLIAFEMGSTKAEEFGELIGFSDRSTKNNEDLGSPWYQVPVGVITVDGNSYYLYEYIYHGEKLSDGSIRHEKGILPAGDTTYPSLAQVYLSHTATNEDCEALDGNNNGTYDILVLSQAGQVEKSMTAEAALDMMFGDVTAENAAKWFSEINVPTIIEVKDGTSEALDAAIASANEGDIVRLTEDVAYTNSDYPNIEKAITVDLNGKTLTTTSNGIIAKGGCSIINGTVFNPVGGRAAIRAWNIDKIENVVIDAPENGGISVQQGDCSIGTIKDVTIGSKTYGIESYRSTAENTVDKMENVKINAEQLGIHIVGAGKFGEIENCEIVGATTGIQGDLTGLYHIALNISNSKITGTADYGIDIWDEAYENTGSTVTLNYDDATVFKGGIKNIKISLGDEVTCTVNGEKR